MQSDVVGTVDVPEPMLPRPFEVAAVRKETADTVTLNLRAADNGPPIEFLPGQFTMVYIFGVGGSADFDLWRPRTSRDAHTHGSCRWSRHKRRMRAVRRRYDWHQGPLRDRMAR